MGGFAAVFDKGFTNKLNLGCEWPTPQSCAGKSVQTLFVPDLRLVRKSYARAKPKLGKLQNVPKKIPFLQLSVTVDPKCRIILKRVP